MIVHGVSVITNTHCDWHESFMAKSDVEQSEIKNRSCEWPECKVPQINTHSSVTGFRVLKP